MQRKLILISRKNRIRHIAFTKNGGDGGIRTLDTLLTYTHFPGVLLQPLGHVSRIFKVDHLPRFLFALASDLLYSHPKSMPQYLPHR